MPEGFVQSDESIRNLAEPGAMRLSGAGRAALLVLLAAHFQTSLALEEKKGKY